MTLYEAQDGFDAEPECRALRPGLTDTVFAVACAGDHVLALLGAGPKLVIAVEPREAQAYLLELKLAGLKALAHAEFLELLGAKDSRRRPGLYQRVRWLLSSEADGYWSGHPDVLDRGILGQGCRERALAGFRRFVSLVQGQDRVRRFLALADPLEQGEVLRREWDGFAWRRFSGRVLAGALGHPDPAMCLRRLEAVMTRSPARENFILAWLLAGKYAVARPFYLREDAFDSLKVMANRVVVVCDQPERVLAGLPAGSIDAFALGDAWDELQNKEPFMREIGRTGDTGARLAARLRRKTGGGEEQDRTVSPGGFWIATIRPALAAIG
ncbi:MAG: DUF3419 family protein [Planctomycetes bacterium]|nr:DUF3419 family protein [Planctomycetota bacterium]